jgi:hypothetical protein
MENVSVVFGPSAESSSQELLLTMQSDAFATVSAEAPIVPSGFYVIADVWKSN